MRILSRSLVAALILTAGIFFSSCGDDATGPDPNAGKTWTVMFLNVNPDFPSPVNFADGSDLVLTSVPYGAPTQAQVQIGTRTIAVKATGGTALASTGVQVDSSRPVWVIHAGAATAYDAIGVDAKKDTAAVRTALNAGAALIRLINASKNGGAVTLHIGTKIGGKVADNLDYKKVSDFTAVDTATKALVLTKGTTTDTVAVAPLSVSLAAGKLYTVVFYGSSDAAAAAEQKLMLKIVSEP